MFPDFVRASELPLLNPLKIHAAMQSSIERYKTAPKSILKQSESKFKRSGHAALAKPTYVEANFHQRTADLNRIPFFYSAFETEIASPADIQTLPSGKKEEESTRLIAKRFIDSATGKSIFSDPSVGKGNPPIQMQEMPVREIRAEAATATVDKYSGKYIHDLYKYVIEKITRSSSMNMPLTVHLIRPARGMYADDCTVNFLSLAAQREVTESLNVLAQQDGKSQAIQFADNKNVPVLSRTARSNASPIGRLVQQGYLDTSEIQNGDQVIIVDDHTQAGGTILAMAAAMTNAGATVLAATTPTTHPFCASLAMSSNVNDLLKKTLNTWDVKGKMQAKLAEFGMPIDTLTNHEAMIVIAYATDPKDPEARQNFLSLEEALYGNHRVMEGESDSLIPVLNQEPMSPAEVVKEMERESAQSRKVTAATSTKEVHVLDWDDFLRDEKGMNYQLMHNALVIAAHNYGKDYPILAELAESVAEHRGKYVEGMPMLCMSEEQFTDFTIRQEKILKKDMVTDLLAKLGALNPDLKKKFQNLSPRPKREFEFKAKKISDKLNTWISGFPEKEMLKMGARNPDVQEKSSEDTRSPQKVISNILYQEFLRQYQIMIRPVTEENLTPKALDGIPFPDVRPRLMAGAAEMLERIRTPESFVALVSNRGERDVHKEVNKYGWAHYFDVVSGTPELTQTDETGNTTVKRKFSKPNDSRLEEILEKHPHLRNANWDFWGDTTKDITQAIPMIKKRRLEGDRIRGIIVNPNPAIQNQPNEQMGNDLPEPDRPQIISADTLTEPSLFKSAT